ncbi:MAG TPA: aspartate/glutamate racemase family protein [Stellaceae bacterium]|nr:aspartate/glutamate racemase family protein [Stellaceae bacterium]
MTRRVMLGMLTPSSNTVLEPVLGAMVAGVPGLSLHFARFPVTEISLADKALGQFEIEPMLAAARLLADARVSAICWNGTSAGWLGFERDRALCRAIAEATRVPATSSVLALAEILRLTGVTRLGLVSPYIPAVQERIAANFAREGSPVMVERHLGISENFAFSEVGEETLARMIREVAAAKPQAITVFCTNLRAAPMVEELEHETGIPIYDTVATALWSSLRLAGASPRAIAGWGRLFREVG